MAIMFFKVLLLLALRLIGSVKGAVECLHRDYGNTGSVCVCNVDHCDTIDPIKKVGSGQFVTYSSNLAGKRFDRQVEQFAPTGNGYADVINHSQTYQALHGFGGAFTDATGININSLDGQARKFLMRSYFSNEGLEYSLVRVPIGGTDFSTRSYSYLDTSQPDLTLSAFALQPEDLEYKIPLILEAKNLTNGNLNLFASAWTAPAWMKTNEAQNGFGQLKRDYWQLWADYFIKFFDLYKDQGIEFWGLTTGNEPSLALFTFLNINSVGWIPSKMSEWIRTNLGPTVRNSAYADLRIMAHDDQRILLPLIFSLFSDKEAKDYIDGIAVHWYWNDFVPASWQTNIHDKYPDKFFINTEACKGDKPWEKAVVLGSWSRGEKYAIDIIENLQHWAIGWIDWNMALNTSGGPSYINNNVDSPIIVNETINEFYKQPMYYAIGHYSKFLTRGSVRVQLPYKQNGMQLVAFDRPDRATVVVVINSKENDVQINLQDANRGYITKIISAKSFNTIIYW